MSSTAQRGYGADHQRLRRAWQQRITDGEPIRCACARPECRHHDGQCPTTLAGTAWDLGHTDDRTAWTGPECIPCNRSAGGRNGNRAARANAATVIRQW